MKSAQAVGGVGRWVNRSVRATREEREVAVRVMLGRRGMSGESTLVSWAGRPASTPCSSEMRCACSVGTCAAGSATASPRCSSSATLVNARETATGGSSSRNCETQRHVNTCSCILEQLRQRCSGRLENGILTAMSRMESLLCDSRRVMASAAPEVSFALRPQRYCPTRMAWSKMPCARMAAPGLPRRVASVRMNSCIDICTPRFSQSVRTTRRERAYAPCSCGPARPSPDQRAPARSCPAGCCSPGRNSSRSGRGQTCRAARGAR